MGHHGLRAVVAGCCAALAAVLLLPIALHAEDVDFASGSLIIPMDTSYQDLGMLRAYGLVDSLLRDGVPVSWCILPGKVHPGDVDFTANAMDWETGAAITNHGYRGGPFVIAGADVAPATPVITAWRTANPTVTVHVATQSFTAPLRLRLTASPRIAVLADGSQNILFGYLNAAGITDESGLPWSAGSVDLLALADVAGPSTTDPDDGALFDSYGQPRYCVLASGHWSVSSADIPYVVPEIKSFLQFPTHLFAECQSVLAIENATPGGGLLTSAGLQSQPKPTSAQFSNSDLPFAQMDGAFQTVGGSEPAFGLVPGSEYDDIHSVMVLSAAAAGPGIADIWIAGYYLGTCPVSDLGSCTEPGPKGKVTYLGGHQYPTALPISANPSTQGVRLFLNSLFAGSCAHAEGQPVVSISAAAPETTTTATVTFTLGYENAGLAPGRELCLEDSLPINTEFVSATGGGTHSGGVVTWNLGELAPGASGSVSLTATLSSFATYTNRAAASFKVGLTGGTASSNATRTVYAAPGTDAPIDVGSALSLESVPNPTQGGRLMVRFALPRREHAVIEVYDVRGRRLLRRDVGSFGAGSHALDLAGERHLSSGIYFLRLRQGAEARTALITVLD